MKYPLRKYEVRISNSTKNTISRENLSKLLFKLPKIIKTGKATRRYLGIEDNVPEKVGTTVERIPKNK